MSLRIEKLSDRFETGPATRSPHQQHLERVNSTQDLQPRAHQLQHNPFIKRPKLDLWSKRLGEKTVKQFEELARDFAEQDTIEDILNWNEYLLEQLKDEQLIDEYNAWSEEYFKPQPRVDNIVEESPVRVFTLFQIGLRHADWNVGNQFLDVVSSMMLYGRRLCNKGYILHTEAFKSDLMPYDDFERWIDVAEWTDNPFILALGIRDDGGTEGRDGRIGQFYFIHNPTFKSEITLTETEDPDDDAQDIIFCRKPPPYTVARVKGEPKYFLAHQMSFLQSATNIDLEPLSLSTPEIVETSTTKGEDGRCVRFGLFPK